MTSSLDPSLVERAAPAGSLRYFAWLYAPEAHRDALAATFLIRAELQDSANAPHEVAHVRLQWWREEANNLMARRAQHPATRVLQHAGTLNVQHLHDAVLASAQDLACSTYETDTELSTYLRHSGGALCALAMESISDSVTDALREAAIQLGAFIRRAEILRDLRNDIHHGRLYLPLSPLDALQIGHDALQSRDWPPVLVDHVKQRCLQALRDLKDLEHNLTRNDRITLRPLLVLSELHARLLTKLATDPNTLTRQRLELGGFETLWTAWRTARRHT